MVVDALAERLDFVGRYLACEGIQPVLLAQLDDAVEQAQLCDADVLLVAADAAMEACVDSLRLATETGRPSASWARATAAHRAA